MKNCCVSVSYSIPVCRAQGVCLSLFPFKTINHPQLSLVDANPSDVKTLVFKQFNLFSSVQLFVCLFHHTDEPFNMNCS